MVAAFALKFPWLQLPGLEMQIDFRAIRAWGF